MYQTAFFALLQVILIDLVLAGDNAVVIGLAAARVPAAQRSRVILWGLAAAVILRIGLALLTVKLLAITGLMLAGGLLLLWVCWRLYRDLKNEKHNAHDELDPYTSKADQTLKPRLPASRKTLRRVILRIMVADLSMSLDNVLAVAGAAMRHPWVLVIGLLLSIGLVGAAASIVARLIARYRWIGYAGLLIVLFVALRMIVIGGGLVADKVSWLRTPQTEEALNTPLPAPQP